jgi:hypothetical protein
VIPTATRPARREPTCGPDHGATDPGVGGRSNDWGEAGTESALCDNPDAWMMPVMRSTEALARLGAKGKSATASSATFV